MNTETRCGNRRDEKEEGQGKAGDKESIKKSKMKIGKWLAYQTMYVPETKSSITNTKFLLLIAGGWLR